MSKRSRLVCVIAWLLLICGCQSFSLPPKPPAAVQCQPPPPPPPAAWFMAPQVPNLTQRMLNELSASQTPATKD